jgi:hypothetical protein
VILTVLWSCPPFVPDQSLYLSDYKIEVDRTADSMRLSLSAGGPVAHYRLRIDFPEPLDVTLRIDDLDQASVSDGARVYGVDLSSVPFGTYKAKIETLLKCSFGLNAHASADLDSRVVSPFANEPDGSRLQANVIASGSAIESYLAKNDLDWFLLEN